MRCVLRCLSVGAQLLSTWYRVNLCVCWLSVELLVEGGEVHLLEAFGVSSLVARHTHRPGVVLEQVLVFGGGVKGRGVSGAGGWGCRVDSATCRPAVSCKVPIERQVQG